MKYDLAVAGGSRAGIYAAAVAAAYGKNVVLFKQDGLSDEENSLIKSVIDNNEMQIMASRRLKQMVSPQKMSDMIVFDKDIEGLTELDEGFSIKTDKGSCEVKTLLCASADSTDVLPGEQFFVGRGVSYNWDFDAQAYSGKKVAVVSWVPDAVGKVKELAAVCEEVVFVQYCAGVNAGLPENVKLVTGVPASVTGTDHITGISVPKEYYAVDEVFIFRKSCTVDIFLPELEKYGRCIVTDKEGKTNIEGVWACGGCAKWPDADLPAEMQGQIAGMSIVEYLAT